VQVVRERCCGLDVHKKTVTACCITPEGRETRTFGTMTPDILEMANCAGLVEAAWCAAHVKNTYLSAQYHRIAARRGSKRAAVAVAHTILVIAYHLLKQGENYRELGGDYFDSVPKTGWSGA
jgi:hypothetical protein